MDYFDNVNRLTFCIRMSDKKNILKHVAVTFIGLILVALGL